MTIEIKMSETLMIYKPEKIELWLIQQKNLLTTEKKQTKINIKISIRRQHYEIIF